jgi:ABC-type glycerol-3-phosphate transport system permease component
MQLGPSHDFGGLVVLLLLASATTVCLLRHIVAAFPLDLVDVARLHGSGSRAPRFPGRSPCPPPRPRLAAVTVIEFVTNWNHNL